VANNNKTKAAAVAAPEPVSRLQRALMYMAGSVLGLGIVAIVALLIGEATIAPKAFQGSPFWATAALLPAIAIPLGFALLIALLVVTFLKRSQAAKDAGK
jgi:uncharacterized RDD family membrane protein YckC